MNKLLATLLTATLVVFPSALLAQDKDDIHVVSKRTTSANLSLNDGAGYLWDIINNGVVNDGSNDAYDTGMQLSVNNSTFTCSSSCKLSADGREIEMGPWNFNGVNVYRRIYIEPGKKGYCRWIDIFDNTSGKDVSLTIQYYTNTGGIPQSIYTASGKTSMGDKEWAVATLCADNASNPSLVHVFASKGSKVRPTFQWKANDDNMYYNLTITAPAGKPTALCFFEAQRNPPAEAKKLVENFDLSTELDKVPPGLRKILLNMGGGTTTMSLGKLDLPRNDKQDLAVLRNGDELLGDIQADKFTVDTPFGKLDLDAKKIVGFSAPEGDNPSVAVILVDGQVVVGKLLSAPVKMKLANGNEMSLVPGKFSSLSYRLSKEKPDETSSRGAAVVLRTGQQLYFAPGDADLTFQTEHGQIKLSAGDLQSIQLDTPEGGLHRAIFRNGSVLSGLLTTQTQKLKLDLGPTLTTNINAIQSIVFPVPQATESGNLSEITLRNEDSLAGKITDKTLTVQTKLGNDQLNPNEISEMVFLNDSLGQVQVKKHSGTTITGKLSSQTIHFKLDGGPELEIFVGHITRITCPAPEGTSTTAPAVTPTPSPAPVMIPKATLDQPQPMPPVNRR